MMQAIVVASAGVEAVAVEVAEVEVAVEVRDLPEVRMLAFSTSTTRQNFLPSASKLANGKQGGEGLQLPWLHCCV